MTKYEFLSNLEHRLRVLPETERRDAIEYYEGYFMDANEDEAAALERLGSPAEVAANIIAEYAMSSDPKNAEEQPKKRGLSVVWAVILAVFALPVGLPVAIAVASVAFALLIVIFSLVVSFGATALGLTVGGIGYFVIGIFVLTQNIPLALMMLGSSLLVFGIGILFLKLTVLLSKSGFNFIARFVGKVIMRRRGK